MLRKFLLKYNFVIISATEDALIKIMGFLIDFLRPITASHKIECNLHTSLNFLFQ